MEDRMPFEMPDNMGEQHVACVLLVDCSGSMGGAPLRELEEGLKEFGAALEQDAQARGCVDVCVISFSNDVQTEVPFCPATSYMAPVLSAGGLTSMNQAILAGLEAIEERKSLYKSLGVSYFRPWMFLLTDGAPTDGEYEGVAKQKLGDAVRGNKVNFFPMGIGEGADIATLKSYSDKGIIMKATASNFKDAFVWLSNSLSITANSFHESKIDLPPFPDGIQIEIL